MTFPWRSILYGTCSSTSGNVLEMDASTSITILPDGQKVEVHRQKAINTKEHLRRGNRNDFTK